MQTNPAQYAGWSLVIIYDFDDEAARENNIEPRMVSIYLTVLKSLLQSGLQMMNL